MAIPEKSEYKGWDVLVFNATGFQFFSTAWKQGEKRLYSEGGRGKGSKQRAFDSVKKKVDEREQSVK